MVLGFPPSAAGLRSGWRATLLRILATAVSACAFHGVAEAGERGAVSEIKAGYLYKLTPFVEWPIEAFDGSSSPFRLCIGGHDPFGGYVDRVARGRRVGDHPVVVVRLGVVPRNAACHLLFLGASTVQSPRQMLDVVAGQPVLTVADETLDAPDAMIQFVRVEGRIRFEIRAGAAQAGGLILSSKLQALSATPKDGGR